MNDPPFPPDEPATGGRPPRCVLNGATIFGGFWGASSVWLALVAVQLAFVGPLYDDSGACCCLTALSLLFGWIPAGFAVALFAPRERDAVGRPLFWRQTAIAFAAGAASCWGVVLAFVLADESLWGVP